MTEFYLLQTVWHAKHLLLGWFTRDYILHNVYTKMRLAIGSIKDILTFLLTYIMASLSRRTFSLVPVFMKSGVQTLLLLNSIRWSRKAIRHRLLQRWTGTVEILYVSVRLSIAIFRRNSIVIIAYTRPEISLCTENDFQESQKDSEILDHYDCSLRNLLTVDDATS